MICWLASYPRSGCDVLRIILRAAFDLRTFNLHEPDGVALGQGIRNAQKKAFMGQEAIPGPWVNFYAKAMASPSLTLIKTHGLPLDSSPCIHIIRDGRSCLSSFTDYTRSYYPNDVPALKSLIQGEHAIGSWQEHYFAWKSRPEAPRLLMRYEELLNGSNELVEKLACFLNLPQPLTKDWTEIHVDIMAACPAFEQNRMPVWQRPLTWTDEDEVLFWLHHSRAMEDMGYGMRKNPGLI